MKQSNSRVNAAETENAAGKIQVVLIKVKDRRTGEIKKVDTAEYLYNLSFYERMGGYYYE